MRISAKGRYALAAMVCMAQNFNSNDYLTVISISEKLGISKIYLEQVFSLLKRGSLVISIKGAQGGYKLAKSPEQLTLYDILAAVETSLFETAEDTAIQKAPEIDAAMKYLAFDQLDKAVKTVLEQTSLNDLLLESQKHKKDQSFMFYI